MGVAIKLQEQKRRLVHLMSGMKSGLLALFIMALTGTLVISAFACPLWVGLRAQGAMPCPKDGSAPDPCPLAICEASSGYLASQVSAHAPLLQELPFAVTASSIPANPLESVVPVRRDDRAPPGPAGPLFLETHSLRI